MQKLLHILRKIWDWLGNSDNRGRIQFIFASIVAVSGWIVLFYSEITTAASAIFSPPPPIPELPTAQTGHTTYIDAQEKLEKRLSEQVNTNRAKNIVLITAEGMGVSVNTLFRIGVGQAETGSTGEDFLLPHDRFEHIALIKTFQADSQTAGSGFNDVFTGVRANTGNIGTQASRSGCSDIRGKEFSSIAELMASMGKSTGIVTNTRVTYSSVAANYAKISDRSYEDYNSVPEGCSQTPINEQLISSIENRNIDIVLGGGRDKFKTSQTSDPDDIIWKEPFKDSTKRVMNVFNNASALDNLDTDDDIAQIGLFADGHMAFEADRKISSVTRTEPSLGEMTRAALGFLSKNNKGYFLNITSGRIDHALHSGAIPRAIEEAKALKDVLDIVMATVDTDNTLVVLATGHDMSVTMNGYCARGKPITGLCYFPREPETLVRNEDGQPYPIVTMANGPRTFSDYPDLSKVDFDSINYIAPAGFRTRSATHSPADVVVYADGPWAHLVSGTMEQNMLFHLMLYASTNEE